MQTNRLIGAVVITVLLASSYALVQTAGAQESGDTVVFAVPQGTPITIGQQGDVITYVAESSGSADVGTTCPVAGTEGQLRPRQSVIIVDPGAGDRPTRLAGLITLKVNGQPRTTEMPNGTRLSGMNAPTQCFFPNEFPYFFDVYAATVE